MSNTRVPSEASAAAGSEKAPAASKPQPVSNGAKGNILLVDDDKFLVDMYGLKFSAAGYTIQTCLSASEALQALKGGFEPDAVVFDLVMPEKDGFAFVQEVNEAHLAQKAPKIALTNQSVESEKKKAEELGVDRYVVKASMIPSEVVQLVGEEIAKKRGTK